jgi:flagellar export protein FliJ
MTNKQKRIQRVVVHREKELDKRVVELGEARAAVERSEGAVAAERARVERAAAEREAMSERAMTAAEWREANEWLESRKKSEAVAAQELERANRQVVSKQGHVLDARRALKGVELYETRLKQEELKTEDRADQRLQDELARTRTGRNRSKA